MELLVIGLLGGICSMLLVDRFKPQRHNAPIEETEEEKKQREAFDNHFNNMMNYNVTTAMGAKKDDE